MPCDHPIGFVIFPAPASSCCRTSVSRQLTDLEGGTNMWKGTGAACAWWLRGPLSLCALNVSSASAIQVGAAADWPNYAGGTDESGYSRLDEIKGSNIGRLGLSWFLDLPGEVSLEATPLAIN